MNPDVLSGQDATAPVIALIDQWHPALKWLVQTTDVSTVTAFAVKTSVPIRPWLTQRVTLLGDALHNMTPFRGIGTNTALRDAAALRQALVAVARGQGDIIEALAAYERDMIEYGFAAVQTSLNDMKRFHAKGLWLDCREVFIPRISCHRWRAFPAVGSERHRRQWSLVSVHDNGRSYPAPTFRRHTKRKARIHISPNGADLELQSRRAAL